jgi:hypothetical protein
MRGDLLLYTSSGSLSDRIIAWATHGPFVHVEIDLEDGNAIGALSTGITIHPYLRGQGRVEVPIGATEKDREYGLLWALQQVNKQYGWVDIISNGLKILGIPFDIGETDHWDCSDFVTRYLLAARAAGPLGRLADNPGLVSPNDIARAFGVLKEERHG